MNAARAGADIGFRGPNRTGARPAHPANVLVPAGLMAVLGTPSLRVQRIASNSSGDIWQRQCWNILSPAPKAPGGPEETLKLKHLMPLRKDCSS